jgi:hypothetical protein
MGRKTGNGDGTFPGRQRRRQPHEEFEDCMGRETKIAFDEALPGELVVIVLFALFLVLVISLLFGLT